MITHWRTTILSQVAGNVRQSIVVSLSSIIFVTIGIQSCFSTLHFENGMGLPNGAAILVGLFSVRRFFCRFEHAHQVVGAICHSFPPLPAQCLHPEVFLIHPSLLCRWRNSFLVDWMVDLIPSCYYWYLITILSTGYRASLDCFSGKDHWSLLFGLRSRRRVSERENRRLSNNSICSALRVTGDRKNLARATFVLSQPSLLFTNVAIANRRHRVHCCRS